MKTCPHCAEEIQAAAIVCKHCHRDLVASVPRSRSSTRRWILRTCLAVGVILSGLYGLHEYQRYLHDATEYERYLAFTAQLEAWHDKCDAVMAARPAGTAGARACAEELRALKAANR
jgi:hypothetical protein